MFNNKEHGMQHAIIICIDSVSLKYIYNILFHYYSAYYISKQKKKNVMRDLILTSPLVYASDGGVNEGCFVYSCISLK